MSDTRRVDPRDVFNVTQNKSPDDVNSTAIGWVKWAKGARFNAILLGISGIGVSLLGFISDQVTVSIFGAACFAAGIISNQITFLIEALAEMNKK